MPSLRAQRLTFGWADAAPIVVEADLHLAPGWTALVGANGAGKSTLLRLLAGDLTPSSGVVRLDPRGASVHLCPQSTERPGEAERALAVDRGGAARALRAGLRLERAPLGRWPVLSHGERRRWQVAAALHAGPQVLLLDEPTNHLDAEGRALLAEALRRHVGPGLIVSHDRALLEALCTRTVLLHQGGLRAWPLRYGEARAAWEAEVAGRWAGRAAAQGEARRAARLLEEARRRQASADRSRSLAGQDPADRDARGMGARTVAAWAEDAAGRQVTVRRRALASARAKVPPPPLEPRAARRLTLPFEPCPRPVLLSLDLGAVPPGPLRPAPGLTVQLGRSARVRLEGPNGAGKSSLIAALRTAAGAAASRVLWLPQELGAAARVEALEAVQALDAAARGRALELAAALGADPGRLLASRSPSPGEAVKLLLAQALARRAWGLVLDEPTNHLDLPSIERLEAALRAWPGALLLVTHDERLAAACTLDRWRLAGGVLAVG